MSRTKLVAGNWKMHTTAATGTALAQAVAEGAAGAPCDLAVCPPFPYLAQVGGAIAGSKVRLGAQDVHWEASGAFTGAVAPDMLVDLGCHDVLLGHSERRQLFGESDASVRRKLAAADAAGLTAIVCVGETEAEREDGLTGAILERQVLGAFDGITLEGRCEVAYEPVWAIGTGRTATPDMVAEAHALIRSLLGRSLGPARAANVRILYGGSVNPSNAAELLHTPEVDGALVGGASLDAESFLAIAAAAAPR